MSGRTLGSDFGWQAIARALLMAFGGAAIAWGLATLPFFWHVSSIERSAKRIIAGEPYKSDLLSTQLDHFRSIEKRSYCRPTASRAAAIVTLRQTESAADAKTQAIAERLKRLDDSIISALSCSPADPFLWMVLYWVRLSENVSLPEALKFLHMSYRLGPNEGWIALKRNRLSFSIFSKLPADMAEQALEEFVALVDTNFIEDAADIFVGPAWPERDMIVPRLARVPLQNRQWFSDAIRARGRDITIPGTTPPQRSWRG